MIPLGAIQVDNQIVQVGVLLNLMQIRLKKIQKKKDVVNNLKIIEHN